MKPYRHPAISWVGVAVFASGLLSCTAQAGRRASRMVQPTFEKMRVEKPAFDRPGKRRHPSTVPLRVQSPGFEKPVLEQPVQEKPIQERSFIEPPGTVEVFHRPPDYQKTQNFPNANRRWAGRRFLRGPSKDLTPYRLGPPTSERREDSRRFRSGRLRNPNARRAYREP